MTKQEAQEFSNMNRRITRLEKQLSDFTEMLHEDSQAKLDLIAIISDIDIWGDEDDPEPEEEGED